MPLASWSERLRAHSPDGLALRPGATEATIAKAEEALGHRLPADLRVLLLETDGFEDRAGQWEVAWPVRRISAETLQWRQRRPILSGFVCFGDNGAGDPFLLSRSNDSAHIWNDIDDHSYRLAPSLDAFWEGWLDGSIKT